MQTQVSRRPRSKLTCAHMFCALTVTVLLSSALIAPAYGQTVPTLPAPGVTTTVSWAGETFDGVPGMTPAAPKKTAKKKKTVPPSTAATAPPTKPADSPASVAETAPAAPTTTKAPKKSKSESTTDSAPSTAPSSPASGDAASNADVWAKLRKCESGGNYAINTGNGYYGAYQFALATWKGLGYSGYPHEATPATQDEAAKKLQAKGGWGQWPACSRKLGLR
jgi:resuscitation-promoting factor RpfB